MPEALFARNGQTWRQDSQSGDFCIHWSSSSCATGSGSISGATSRLSRSLSAIRSAAIQTEHLQPTHEPEDIHRAEYGTATSGRTLRHQKKGQQFEMSKAMDRRTTIRRWRASICFLRTHCHYPKRPGTNLKNTPREGSRRAKLW